MVCPISGTMKMIKYSFSVKISVQEQGQISNFPMLKWVMLSWQITIWRTQIQEDSGMIVSLQQNKTQERSRLSLLRSTSGKINSFSADLFFSSGDNFCKQFGPRSGLTERQA